MRRILSLILCFLLICSLSVVTTGCAAADLPVSAGGTTLVALNIGKADCLLLLAHDKAYLIDTGYEHTFGSVREMLRQYNITHLDGVFLTHCDKDHYGGLMQLSQSDIAVDAWYAPAIYHDVKPGQHPMELAVQARSAAVTWLHAGDEITIADGATFRVLAPIVKDENNENNNSLVLHVTTADGTLLLTGDMKLEEERTLMASGANLTADVLKVAFHGDNSSSSESFLHKVMPQVAIICTSSVEEPDTPASSVLRRLGLLGAQCAVTQDYAQGIVATLTGGKAQLHALSWAQTDYSFIRASIDVTNDILTLRNSSAQDVSLAGWIIHSSRGDTAVTLPDNAMLPANGVFKLGTRETESSVTLKLDQKRLWHKSKLDRATIYDAAGAVVIVTDNGMPE